jgi:hypothetical protein
MGISDKLLLAYFHGLLDRWNLNLRIKTPATGIWQLSAATYWGA